MNITLKLSKKDLAKLQDILADDIARLDRERNDGRWGPVQLYLIHEQLALLKKVNLQLFAAATADCPRLPRRAKGAKLPK